MAGTPPGEARLILEVGHSRFPVHASIGKKPTSAATLLAVLPPMVAQLTAQLERAQVREEESA